MAATLTEFGSRNARVLADAATALEQEAAAQVRLLVAAAEWADANIATGDEPRAGWGDGTALFGEAQVLLAGPGAPQITEFCVYEFAATLGWSTEATRALLADALELSHRLPRLWDLTVIDQMVPVRVARHIASCTTDLSWDAAKDADRLVCADPRHVSRVRAEKLVHEIRLWHDPDRAVADEEEALTRRGVWTRPGGAPATTEMLMVLDTFDAHRLDHTLSQMARVLKGLGDTDTLDVRRAKAVGVLADPQLALGLLTKPEPTGTGAGPSTELFVHLSDDALLARTEDGTGTDVGGPVTIEKLGVATQKLIADWLSPSTTGMVGTIIIRPVLDMSRADAVNQHDPPEWMRTLVVLRDAHCIFPGCHRDSRSCDLDHINPWTDPDHGGPPAQTHPANLAPLCRRHHRAKTHGTFTYQRHPDGSYHWTLPTGDHITVTPTSRRPL